LGQEFQLPATAVPAADMAWYQKDRIEVPGEDLVVGDLLVLTPGTYIGADGRTIKSCHLKLDESP
jgi:magnesium-transporting ATPase (P-type)